MKDIIGEVRTIHPEVLSGIGMEAATALLQVARGLRSGAIHEEWYDQEWLGNRSTEPYGKELIRYVSETELVKGKCIAACCIMGWTRAFTTKQVWQGLYSLWCDNDDLGERLDDLFDGNHPSNPTLAADAIEAFIYNYAEYPWSNKR